MGIGSVTGSIPANDRQRSQISWRRLSIFSFPRCISSRWTYGPYGPVNPRPSRISVVIARATTSREASSRTFGAYFVMNRSPEAFFRIPPSPRAPSVTRMPPSRRAVGWNWTNSMSFRNAPARYAAAIPSAGAAVRVRRPTVDAASPAGGDDDGLRRHHLELPGLLVEGDDPLDPPVPHDDPGQLPLLVEREPRGAELLPQSLQERETGPVRGVDRTREPGAPERPLGERAVLGAGEDGAEMLHLDDRRAGLPTEELDRVLVSEVVGPLDGVEDVGVDRIVHSDRRVDTALGRARMRPQGVQLRDDGDVPPGLDRRERRALPGEARTDHDDFVTQHRDPGFIQAGALMGAVLRVALARGAAFTTWSRVRR